jgi:dTDP-4-dehydrorhamnose reductase
MKRILVTGGSGQIGSAVAQRAEMLGFSVATPLRSKLNLADATSIAEVVRSEPWHSVINCGAYTAVDGAEAEPELAHRINAEAPFILARETARLQIPLIHVSTDYVFDGTKPTFYNENDPVNPVNVYGRTKEAGEAAVRETNPKHAIVRTAWVVSAGGANFLNTMLRLAKERDAIEVVDDQIGCPSSAVSIASALLTIAADMDARSGTWHFVNDGEASWHGLAEYIFGVMSARGLAVPKLSAISTDAYPTTAKRPANSRLATEAFQRDFMVLPRHWHETVGEILSERLA